MKKSILAIAAAATIAAGTLAVPNTADARCHGCGVAAGVIGGIAAGAIIGSAIANSHHRHHYDRYRYRHHRYDRYRRERGYVAYDGYRRPYPVDCPGGYWARRPLYSRHGHLIGWSRPRFICP